MNKPQFRDRSDVARGRPNNVEDETVHDTRPMHDVGRPRGFEDYEDAFGDLAEGRRRGNEMEPGSMNTQTMRRPDTDRSVERTIMSTGTLTGNDVYNTKNETLGSIQELMMDTRTGTIRYAVMASGGFLGMGNRLFAIPWDALTLDLDNHRFILDVDAERIKAAPGFDKSEWPDMGDSAWADQIHTYYGSGSEMPLR